MVVPHKPQTQIEQIWKYFVLPRTGRGVAMMEIFAAKIFQSLAFAEKPTILDVCGGPEYVSECNVKSWIKTRKYW